jgi:hypothetical protein
MTRTTLLHSWLARWRPALALSALALVSTCFGFALACATPSSPIDAARSVADRTVQAIERGDVAAAAAQLHYPPSYTKSQRSDDAAAVAESLTLFLTRFGRPGQIEPRRDASAFAFFEVGAGGGDLPYWQAVSPFRTLDFVYEAWFENFGPGFLVVRVLVPGAGLPREVQRLGFALPVDPLSKRRVVEVMAALFALKNAPQIPDLEQLFDWIHPTEIRQPAI